MEDKPLNVLVVFGHRGKLGAIRVITALHYALEAKGIKLFFVVEDRRNFARFTSIDDSRVFEVKGLTDWRNVSGRLAAPLTVLRLLKVWRACKADILYAYHLSTFPFVWIVSKLAQAPHLVALRNVYPDGVPRYRKFMITRAENVLAVSEYMLHVMDEVAGETGKFRGFVVHNAIDAEAFLNAASLGEIPAELRPPPGNVAVGMVSAMDREKNPQFLLRVARRVVDVEPKVTFMFVGRFSDSTYEAETRSLVSRTGLDSNVIFAGQQDKVSSYFAAFDILAHPSPTRPEAFGLVLIEAMAHGKAVVAARNGGIPEVVVDGETGLLCEPNDEEEFAASLLRLIRDRSLRECMGKRGSERVRKCFSIDEIAEKMACAFRQVARVNIPSNDL